MDKIRDQQNKILQIARLYSRDTTLSSRVTEAFLKVPRHRFVGRFYQADRSEWIELDDENLDENITYIYRDTPLTIFKDEHLHDTVSTISQPSFVLFMLELLDLRPGHRVFELGTGSGWSAALMAELVGERGRIDTLEIIPQLVQTAQERLKPWPQVRASFGNATSTPVVNIEEPYDRVVFTAGSHEVPSFLFSKVKEGGLFLFVLRDDDGFDIMFLFQKIEGHFHSIRSLPCRFVIVQGQEAPEDDEFLHELHQKHLRLEDFSLDVYPKEAKLKITEDQRLSKKRESQFLWSQTAF